MNSKQRKQQARAMARLWPVGCAVVWNPYQKNGKLGPASADYSGIVEGVDKTMVFVRYATPINRSYWERPSKLRKV